METIQIRLASILEKMSANAHLLNEGAQRLVRSAGIFNEGSVQDLFLGKFEDSGLPGYARGDFQSVALGSLIHSYVHQIRYLEAIENSRFERNIDADLRTEIDSFFQFLESDPLVLKAFMAYRGYEAIVGDLAGDAFVEGGYLASHRGVWEAALSEPRVQLIQ